MERIKPIKPTTFVKLKDVLVGGTSAALIDSDDHALIGADGHAWIGSEDVLVDGTSTTAASSTPLGDPPAVRG